jgi:glycosyltransferase involved in cell wall biosynthesis
MRSANFNAIEPGMASSGCKSLVPQGWKRFGDMNPKYSVIICTRNRADSLEETLRSIGRVRVASPEPIELLVVDNGSTDRTPEVVRAFDAPNFVLTYLVEEKPGVANARTRALQSAAGEILIWTDDDVRVPPDWIERMAEPIIANGASVVAGGVVPAAHLAPRLAERPLRAFRSWFACTDYLDADRPDSAVGANMAMHRRVRDTVAGFDPALGPGAAETGFGEEALFVGQLAQAGHKIVSAFDVTVEHHFQEERLSAGAVLESARKMGRSHAYAFHHFQRRRSRAIWLHYLVARLRHWWLGRFGKARGDTFPSEKQIKAEERLAFARAYLKLRSTPMKYAAPAARAGE